MTEDNKPAAFAVKGCALVAILRAQNRREYRTLRVGLSHGAQDRIGPG